MLNYPEKERPREKAIQYGIETLSIQELLAIILRTGSKELSVMQLSSYVLEKIGGFGKLHDVDYHQLTAIKGIKQAKAVEILASVELAKRMQNFQEEKHYIREPKDGYDLMKNKLQFEKQEKVYLLCLNSKLEVIMEKLLFIGSSSCSMLEPQEVFSNTLRAGSNRIVLIHNHPSGNPAPSNEDRRITEIIMDMAKKLNIEFVDHLIIGFHCFYSFASDRIYDCKDN